MMRGQAIWISGWRDEESGIRKRESTVGRDEQRSGEHETNKQLMSPSGSVRYRGHTLRLVDIIARGRTVAYGIWAKSEPHLLETLVDDMFGVVDGLLHRHNSRLRCVRSGQEWSGAARRRKGVDRRGRGQALFFN